MKNEATKRCPDWTLLSIYYDSGFIYRKIGSQGGPSLQKRNVKTTGVLTYPTIEHS
jgi:hypothetical protein